MCQGRDGEWKGGEFPRDIKAYKVGNVGLGPELSKQGANHVELLITTAGFCAAVIGAQDPP